MADYQVLRVNAVEEERLFLEATQRVISCILAQKPGRTLIDIAEAISADKKTISNAFNKTHRLSQVFITRLGQAFGPECLDPIAKLMGARFVPLVGGEDDALPSLTASIHKIALARSPDSPGGVIETHCELLGMEGDIDRAIKSLTSLKLRCNALRAVA